MSDMELQSSNTDAVRFAAGVGSTTDARLAYATPTLTRTELSAVIAGPGGSQQDGDFTVSKSV